MRNEIQKLQLPSWNSQSIIQRENSSKHFFKWMNKPVLTSWKATTSLKLSKWALNCHCIILSSSIIKSKCTSGKRGYLECTILCKNDSLCVSLDSLPREENDGIEWIERESKKYLDLADKLIYRHVSNVWQYSEWQIPNTISHFQESKISHCGW